MGWLIAACGLAASLVIAFHLVSPNFRDIRLSMAHLMPPPPQSQAPKQTFSLRNLVASWLFWLRLLCVALIALAVYPMVLPVPPPAAGTQHFRLVYDVSASMATQVADGQTRNSAAQDLAQRAIAQMSEIQVERPDICIDVAFVAGGVTFAPMPQASAQLGAAEPVPQGSPVATLVSALTLPAPNSCNTVPTHVVVVTDQPPQTINQATFGGHLMWQQVGAPRDNLAIWSVDVAAATLRKTTPTIDIRVASFGAMPASVSAEVEGPNGLTALILRRDETRTGGWSGDVAFDGAGTYRVRLMDGGAFSADDSVVLELGAVDRVAVDWRLDSVSRPPALLQVGEGVETVVVAPYLGADMDLPEGPFVLVYDGWTNAERGQGQIIGPFMRDHPILDGVNFDVFERFAPRPAALGESRGLAHVIRPSTGAATWVAQRDSQDSDARGAIVPMVFAARGEDISNLSRLMFFNALSWVAEGRSAAASRLRYVDQDGATVVNARAESNTARALSDAASLSLLNEPVLNTEIENSSDAAPQDSPLTPWLIALAVLLILCERQFGLIWTTRSAR